MNKLLRETEFDFNPVMQRLSKILVLVSSFLYSSELTNDIEISDLLKLYQDDLPDPVAADQEWQLWKNSG